MYVSGVDRPLAFLDADTGAVLQWVDGKCIGFVEKHHYLAPIPDVWAGYRLLIDEETVPIEPYRGAIAWRWRPGFFAGEVAAELRDAAGVTLQRYILDVAPQPGKLGADFFAAMIEEIRAFRSGMLLGTEAANVEIGAAGDFHSMNISYGRLRAYGNLFVQAARQIAARPMVRWRHTRARVPAHQVRRIDRQTLRSMVRTPAAAILFKTDALTGDLGLLDVPGACETVDHAANRAVVFLLRAVLARISRVREQLKEAIRKHEEPTRTSLANREPERTRVLTVLEDAVSRILNASPFDAVTRSELTTAGLNAISASPAYARVYRLAWWILRTGIDANDACENQWMAPTWEIFERWCFLQVMRQVGTALGVSVGDWQIEFKNDCVASAKLHVRNVEVTLTMQDTFRAWDVSTQSRVSVSAERRPDLTLMWTDTSRGVRQWLVLDSKYTTRREGILAAMESAHLYQDSLRWDGQRPCMSLLLTPAACHAGWLMTDDFIDRERVGVLDASDADALVALFRKVLLGDASITTPATTASHYHPSRPC